MDVKNVILNGILQETVFVSQSPSFRNSTYPNILWKLKKALYGLKQALRSWFDRLNDFLLSLGFYSSTADSSLFVLKKNDDLFGLLPYVDDMLITGNLPILLNSFFVAD